jgi:hypothetical protein
MEELFKAYFTEAGPSLPSHDLHVKGLLHDAGSAGWTAEHHAYGKFLSSPAWCWPLEADRGHCAAQGKYFNDPEVLRAAASDAGVKDGDKIVSDERICAEQVSALVADSCHATDL